MNKPAETINVTYLLELMIKRRWLVIVPFCIAMVVGIYLSVTLPRIYEATTLILVQPQKVPSDFVRSVVSSDIDERINTISQQILSRTNIEKIIEQFNLFAEQKSEKLFEEDKINSLRSRIAVKVTSDRRSGADAFSISFQGTDPQKVMNITNALATFFIDENLKVREAQAIGTSSFLDDELQSTKKQLEDVEDKMRQYKQSFMGQLPEQLETNLRIIERLQQSLDIKQATLRDAKIKLIETDNLIDSTRAAVSAGDTTAGPREVSVLDQYKRQLEDLRTRYTEQHPDIIRLKKQIERYEGNKGETGKDDAGGIDSTTTFRTSEANRYFTSLRAQREEINREIILLQSDISKIQNTILSYQDRIEQTPKREQELMSLFRDYQNIKASYSSLLSRKLEAEISVNMEKKQKGEQFRILDQAKLPTKPIKPNMQRLFMMVVGAGIGVGAGLIVLLDFLNKSFKRPEDVEAVLNIPVLVIVPTIVHARDRIKKRLNLALSTVSVFIALALFGAFAALSFQGVEQTKELISRVVG